jgi:hypothetical protein
VICSRDPLAVLARQTPNKSSVSMPAFAKQALRGNLEEANLSPTVWQGRSSRFCQALRVGGR